MYSIPCVVARDCYKFEVATMEGMRYLLKGYSVIHSFILTLKNKRKRASERRKERKKERNSETEKKNERQLFCQHLACKGNGCPFALDDKKQTKNRRTTKNNYAIVRRTTINKVNQTKLTFRPIVNTYFYQNPNADNQNL